MAKEGRIEWLKVTNPFGSGGAQPDAGSPEQNRDAPASDDALLKAFGKFGMTVVAE